MKTLKLFFSIALVALATASFAQHTFSIESFLPAQNQQVSVMLAENHMDESLIEIWIHDLNGRASKKRLWKVYEAPVIARTFFVEEAEVVYDENLGLEGWMMVPFVSDMYEEQLNLEPWMASPFETISLEDDLVLESWMATPFESAEIIELEEWMSGTWH